MAKPRSMIDDQVLCTGCGVYKTADSFYVSNSKRNTLKLTYVCIECSKRKIKTYRETENGYWVGLWNNLSGNAKRRNIEVSITKEDLKSLWELQGGLCAVTGVPMQKASASKSGVKNQFRASVDRIDNEKGYTIDNVRMVCSQVNVMRMDLTDDQLRFWCSAVVKEK